MIFFIKKNGIQGYFKRFTNSVETDKITPTKTHFKIIDEGKWNNLPQHISDFITNKFQEVQKLIDADFEKYLYAKITLKNVYSIALLSELEKFVKEFSSENNIVHISEFNKKIADTVLSEPIPLQHH
jgi:hypothetical protein